MFFYRRKIIFISLILSICYLSGFADAYGFSDNSVNQYSEDTHYQNGTIDYWTKATIFTKSTFKYYANALVFVEGYDATSNNGEFGGINYMSMIDDHLDLQAPGLKEQLIDEGYTLVFIDLFSNHEDIIGQARSLGRMLEIIWNYSNCEPLKVIGFSMGGLVSTEVVYQRNFQNLDNWKYRCNLLATYDSPHSGAYVPKGVYAFADYNASCGNEAAQDLKQALTSPAASQMLINGFNSAMTQKREVWNQHYAIVLNNIKTIFDLRKIGMVNGSWNGITQYNDCGNLAFEMSLSLTTLFTVVVYDFRLFTQGGSTNIAAFCYALNCGLPDVYTHPSTNINLENSPGGWSNFYEAIADSIITESATNELKNDYPELAFVLGTYRPTVYYPNSAFINTFSAAGLSYETFASCTNLEQLEMTMGAMENYSHLDKIYHHNGENQEHCFITDEFKTDLVNEIHNATILPKVIQIITDFTLDD